MITFRKPLLLLLLKVFLMDNGTFALGENILGNKVALRLVKLGALVHIGQHLAPFLLAVIVGLVKRVAATALRKKKIIAFVKLLYRNIVVPHLSTLRIIGRRRKHHR